MTRVEEASSRALLAGVLLALLVSTFVASEASAHPYHLIGGNPDTSVGQGVQTDSTQQLAQSFVVTGAFTLTRVALNVSDIGTTDTLTVQIVSDAAGLPGGSVLASSNNMTGAGFRWANFDLDRWLNLSDGGKYWIVAVSSALAGNGYSWWNSGYNANATGTAAQKVALLPWSIRSDDFAFLLYGWRQTKADLVHRAAAATALAGAETSFLLDLRITGTDAAVSVRIDYGYLGSNLTYRRDTLAATGLVFNLTQRPGQLRYIIANAPPGAYSFAITFLVNRSTPAGTISTTNVSISYADFRGGQWSIPSQTASIRILNFQMSIASGVSQSSADPGSPIEYWLTYATDRLNSSTVRDFRALLKLPQGVIYPNPPPPSPPYYNATLHEVTWALGDLLPGASGKMSSNVSLGIGLPARKGLVANFSASFADSPATRATILVTFPSTIVTAPQIRLELAVNRSSIRSGEIASYTVVVNNSGNGIAGRVWVNDTLDPRVRLDSVRTVGNLSFPPGEVRWNTANLIPGLTTITLNVQALSIIDDGGVLRNSATLGYTDARGNLRELTSFPPISLPIRAPRVIVENLTIDRPRVPIAAEVTETIVLRNVGTERAYSTWVNQTLGPFTPYLRDTFASRPRFSESPPNVTYAWLTPTLDPGGQVTFTVSLRSFNDRESESLVYLHLSGSYSDSFGNGSAVFSSSSRSLLVEAASPFFSFRNPVFLVLIASTVIIGAVGAFERAFGRFRIEELFLVRRDGILMVHESHTRSTNKDADLFAGMFTVVQDFIRDSFGHLPGRQLRQLSFGMLSGFIAPGDLTYLAVMYAGRIGPAVRHALVRFVRSLEAQRGPLLEKWIGEPGQIEDIATALGAITHARPGFMIGLFPPRLRRRGKSASA